MKKENKLRILIWSISCFIVLSLGLTGLIMSGDVGFMNNWFNNNDNEPEEYIDLGKVAFELNLYLENYYLNTDTDVTVTQPDENSISITLTDDSELNYTLTLEEETLSFNYIAEESNEGIIIFNKVVSFIQNEYFGINVEDAIATLNSDEFGSYSLETHGIESIKRNGKIYNKLNVSNPISIISTDSQAIEISDLENSKDNLINDGTYQTSKGNIILYKISTPTETKISIMEKNELTNNSYESFISTLTIIFDSMKAEEFKNKYPSISTNTSFDNYVIEINPELMQAELDIIGTENYKLLRITITK